MHTHTNLRSHTNTSPLPCLSASASLWSEKASIPMRCGPCWCCCFETWGSGMLVRALSTILSHSERIKENQRSNDSVYAGPCLCLCCCKHREVYSILPALDRLEFFPALLCLQPWQVQNQDQFAVQTSQNISRCLFIKKLLLGSTWPNEKLYVFCTKTDIDLFPLEQPLIPK